MKHTHRILSLLLAVLMLAGSTALASCGGDTPATTDPAGSTAPTTTEAPVTTEAPILPAVFDDADFNEYECNILLGLTSLGRNEFIADEADNVFSNAIYRRTKTIEDKFGLYMTTEEHFDGGFSSDSKLTKEYTAGDTNYDLCIGRSYDVATLTTKGYLADLMDTENLDLTKPWWDKTVVEGATLGDSCYFVSGDISTLVNDFVCCIAFNKEMFQKETGDAPSVLYTAVDDGKWTLDMLATYSSKVSEDLDQNEHYDGHDKFGLTVWDSRAIASVHGCGNKVITLDEDGMLTLTLFDERTATSVSNFITMANNQWCLNMSTSMNGVDWKGLFSNEQAMFTMASFNSLDYYRNLSTDYGILPQPKSFADQDQYYSSIVSTHACFFCMPILQKDAARSGAIAELLGYYGKEYLTPAYYTKTLCGTSIRDEESVGSIGICFATKVVDLGDYFSIGDYYGQLASLLNNNQPDGFASMYEKRLKVAEKKIKSINDQIKATQAAKAN